MPASKQSLAVAEERGDLRLCSKVQSCSLGLLWQLEAVTLLLFITAVFERRQGQVDHLHVAKQGGSDQLTRQGSFCRQQTSLVGWPSAAHSIVEDFDVKKPA